MARHFSVNEAKKAFRLFVYWSVRFLLVGLEQGHLAHFMKPDHLRRCHSTPARQFTSQLPRLGFQQRP